MHALSDQLWRGLGLRIGAWRFGKEHGGVREGSGVPLMYFTIEKDSFAGYSPLFV